MLRDRQLAVLMIGGLLLSSGGLLVLTLLSDLQEEHGIPDWGLGVVAAAYFVAALASQLLLAPFADRGHARTMLAAGAMLAVLSLVWLARAEGLAQLVLARGLDGLAIGLWSPAARSMVVGHHTDTAGERLGRLTSAELAGVIIGPLAGAGLANLGGNDTPYYTFAALTVLVVPFVLRMDTPARPSVEHARVRPLSLLRRRPVLMATLLTVGLYAPAGLYEALWSVYLDDLGAGNGFVALTIAAWAGPMVLLSPVGGRLGDRLGATRVALFGLLAVVPLVALNGLVHVPVLLLFLGVAEACVNAMGFPNALAAMARACERHEMATGQGLAGGAGLAAAGLMSLVAAPTYGAAGPELAFGIGAVVCLVLGVVAYRMGAAEPVPAGAGDGVVEPVPSAA